MTTRKLLINKNDEVVGIRVETDKTKFDIPVVDVRRNESDRQKAERIRKNSNAQKGSKYMRPSFSLNGYCYQNSHKK